MKFKTHNEENISINGTSLQGTIDVSYDTLVKTFGEPEEGDGEKTDAEWAIEFPDGTIATIYNWKDGKNYNGPSGMRVEKIRDWYIGGKTKKSEELVKEVLSKAEPEKPKKTFRFTYRNEVYIKANSKEEAISEFENMDKEDLNNESDFVERVSIEEE